MALPTILFNSSTGSDTAASGAGPGTAVTAAAAAHTNGLATTVIIITGSPTLTGIATDGSAALWLKTASGRQWSKITNTDNTAKTITVEDTFTIALASKVDYAVGGKRNSFDNVNSRLLFSADLKPGWTVQTETNQTLNTTGITLSVAGDTTTGAIIIQGSSESPRPIINQTANAAAFIGGAATADIWFKSLQFTNSNGTKTSANGVTLGATLPNTFLNCIFGDATNQLLHAFVRTANAPIIEMIDCEVKNCTGAGVTVASSENALLNNLYIHDNVGGISIAASQGVTLVNSLIVANTGTGITIQNTPQMAIMISGNTIHGNSGGTSDGIDMSSSIAVWQSVVIINNNITANGRYGINGAAGADLLKVFEDYNNFGTGATANGTAAVNGITQNTHDINVNPQYVATGSANYAVGTNLKATGFPNAARNIGANQSGTLSFVDIGAAQRQEAAAATTIFNVME